mmetsp:Transcript_87188/g.154406  ORF Transcript_87188/g.154406 Transcript_87188/m.154406 type:complete len:243 (-) Transcript_87188:86-814(-)
MLGLAFAHEAPPRWQSLEFAVSFRATHLALSFGRLKSLMPGRMPLCSVLTGAGVAALAFASQQPMARPVMQREQCPTERSAAVEFSGDKYCLRYSQDGPAGLARVLVAPRGSEVPNAQDFSSFLDSVEEFASERHSKINSFVAVFDSTQIVWPSMLSIPQIISVLHERQPPAMLRDTTEGIAIIHRDSRWFGMIVKYLVDLVVKVTQPDIVPVFATSREAADLLLVQQVAHRRGYTLPNNIE